ncbi:MAG: hypothetical protein K6G15_04260 [Desulfovibrio sp.]|nr:hypothetical protein [Desulfovibrio sp.]
MKWKSLPLALTLSLCVNLQAPLAEPSVEIDENVTITEGIDGNVEGILKKASGLKSFVLQEVNDADLAKLCALSPNMEKLQLISAENITDLAPLAKLKNLQRLE